MRQRLEEAEEMLRAIRSGEVDALVIDSQGGSQLYTLESADAASNRFRGEILAQIDDVVVAVDTDERITFLNAAAERLYGVRSADMLGHKLGQLRETRWANAGDEAIARALLRERGSWRGENIQIKRSGEFIHIESTVSRMLDASGAQTGLLAVIRDITGRKQSEAAIRESNERLRFMAESMPQKIFTALAAGGVDYFNRQWMEYTGLPFEQIRGGGWLQFVHAEDVNEHTRRWKEAMESGEYFQVEHRFRRHDGQYRWHLTRAHAFRDEAGRITLWIGSSTDIDDWKRDEEKLEATITARTRDLRATNEQLEAFVYSIAHDLRGPLRAVTGFSQILLENHSAGMDEEGQYMLKRIQASSEFLDKLLLDLLAFGRTARAELELVPVVAQRAWEVAVFQCSAEVERRHARLEVRGPVARVLAHEAMLGQCLANLLSNALKFTPPGVQPQIVFRIEPLAEGVRLWVEDQGIGIATEHHERVFRVFERLHGSQFAGTGIGLSIVRKGVERMGGTLGLESAPGEGSRFWIELAPA